MAYVSASHLQFAIAGLSGAHPLAVLVVPAMVGHGVKVVDNADQGMRYGSAVEVKLLTDYFTLPGAPPNKPFRAIWSDDPNAAWRDRLYPGRALQRQRTDRARAQLIFFHKKQRGGRDLWGLRPDCGPQLASIMGEPIPLVDLAIWFGRSWDVQDLDELVREFLRRFPLDQDALIPHAYTRDIPDEYRWVPLEDDPVTEDELAVASTEAAPVESSLAEEVADSDPIFLDAQRLLDEYGGVIFTGPPGTSKSWYAHRIAAKLTNGNLERVRLIQFHPSYQYEDFVQGYIPTEDGKFALTPKHLLEMCGMAEEAAPDPCVIVIDELSRSDPGRVFGEALTYIEKTLRGRNFRLASGHEINIPHNLLFLATMNPLDRGVDEVDAALERRFGKIAMDPRPEMLSAFLVARDMDSGLRQLVEVFFRFVQRTAKQTPAAAIGHTYFRTVKTDDDLRRLWRHQLRFVFEKAFRIDPNGLALVKREWARVVAPQPGDDWGEASTSPGRDEP